MFSSIKTFSAPQVGLFDEEEFLVSLFDFLEQLANQKILDTITYKSGLTQKKLHKKNDAIFSIYGKNGINPWHFFLFSVGPFEVVEAEGGRLVKEANFEAEKKILLKK